ncbi:MAG: transposase family protein [Deinococcus sp.]|uniref:integrase catalytic domain-containing protein n=1 Tax=Deinococcus sp. TaxID=47478 RepID=UPI0026DD2C7F|nr:transposase family protein [Deinococcus sp.]MDO4244602.1 transposase family protein [Deinococcus sp.]
MEAGRPGHESHQDHEPGTAGIDYLPEFGQAVLWPAGGRIQIDATRFALGEGVSWTYVVLDVETRVVLNIHVVRSLSARSAVTALRGGIDELKKLGMQEAVVVMSDGGSDFTSHEFGAACDEVGTWIRAKVSQKGGMGILVRVNRTLKYEFIFRGEPKSKAEPAHSALGSAPGIKQGTERISCFLEYYRALSGQTAAEHLEVATQRIAAQASRHQNRFIGIKRPSHSIDM